MLVLKLCKQFCPWAIPGGITDKISDGADGEVFNLDYSQNKVIKLSVLYETNDVPLENSYYKINKVLHHIRYKSSPTYVCVHTYDYMIFSSREIYNKSQQRFVLYYYVMDKLKKISDDERKVFDSLISHGDSGKEKNFSLPKIKEMISGLNRGLDFDPEKVYSFCEAIQNDPVKHLDLHSRNVMKNDQGYFKCVDLDRCELRN